MADWIGTNKSDTLTGTSEADFLRGRGGHDRLFGLGGDDLFWGGPGEDLADGGPGSDSLSGGPGADAFVFQAAHVETGAVDTVYGFSAAEGDTIRLGMAYEIRAGDDDDLTILDIDGGGEIHVEGARADVESAIGGAAEGEAEGDLTGGDSNDDPRTTDVTLNGGAGDDTLRGGGGDDTLAGGGHRVRNACRRARSRVPGFVRCQLPVGLSVRFRAGFRL